MASVVVPLEGFSCISLSSVPPYSVLKNVTGLDVILWLKQKWLWTVLDYEVWVWGLESGYSGLYFIPCINKHLIGMLNNRYTKWQSSQMMSWVSHNHLHHLIYQSHLKSIMDFGLVISTFQLMYWPEHLKKSELLSKTIIMFEVIRNFRVITCIILYSYIF